jgi:hypothetical protein
VSGETELTENISKRENNFPSCFLSVPSGTLTCKRPKNSEERPQSGRSRTTDPVIALKMKTKDFKKLQRTKIHPSSTVRNLWKGPEYQEFNSQKLNSSETSKKLRFKGDGHFSEYRWYQIQFTKKPFLDEKNPKTFECRAGMLLLVRKWQEK